MTARIALIGLSGAGKSTVAPLLAKRLGAEWIDLDQTVERGSGSAVAAIIETSGEAAFRDLESAALRSALEKAGACGLVLACGAGVLGREENRLLLRGGTFTVWLAVSPGAAAGRLEGAEALKRPLLAGGATRSRLEDHLAARGALYQDAADATVETDRRTPSEVAETIEAVWRERSGWGPSGS